MKILATGGAGFIGSNVVDRLIGEGHSVSVIDNLSSGRKANLNSAARFFEQDVQDAEAIRRTFREVMPDVAIHHAAQIDVRRSTRDPVYDAQVNILGGINLAMATVEFGVRKFIYASTGGAIYGNPEYLPADEKHPVRPISQYGISKHTLEHYLDLYHLNHGLTYTVLRYGNVYGPRQTPEGEAGVVAIFTGLLLKGAQPTIFGKGDKTRDYVFVGDVVEANLAALTLGDNDIFNIATGSPTTDQGVFDAVAAAVGSHIRPIYGDERLGEVRHIHLDASRARERLGWSAQVPFREGVKKTVEYNRTQNTAENS